MFLKIIPAEAPTYTKLPEAFLKIKPERPSYSWEDIALVNSPTHANLRQLVSHLLYKSSFFTSRDTLPIFFFCKRILCTNLCCIGLSSDNALVADYAPKTEVIQTLARYLSDLTLTDEEGIGFCRLPEGKIPHGFHLLYKRCSKRSVYEISPGFTTILCKENSWRSDGRNKESRESV